MFAVGSILAQVRKKQPLVHHITNFVTITDCAAVTRNVGALPVMANAVEEVAEMAASADALVLNIGTLFPITVEAVLEASRAAKKARIPIIFDPVGAGATTLRTESSLLILSKVAPEIIKGNVAEISILAGYGGRIKGVESFGGHDPRRAATQLAQQTGAVVVVTGQEDIVTDGVQNAVVKNGHQMMGCVVGTGCMATSLLGAFAAVEKNFLKAAVAALAAFGVAGEMAAEKKVAPVGPMGYKLLLQDMLFFLKENDLDRRACIDLF